MVWKYHALGELEKMRDDQCNVQFLDVMAETGLKRLERMRQQGE